MSLAALKNEKTISELSARFGIHPTMINNWKRTLLDNASGIFDKGHKATKYCYAFIVDTQRRLPIHYYSKIKFLYGYSFNMKRFDRLFKIAENCNI